MNDSDIVEGKARQCLNCEYWQPDGGGGTAGECRRNPPLIMIVYGGDKEAREAGEDESQEVVVWPPTEPEWWCGEFKECDGVVLKAVRARLVKKELDRGNQTKRRESK